MKLLSLWEPWATLMALGKKRIETRDWFLYYRGWMAIQASKNGLSMMELEDACRHEPFFTALKAYEPFRETSHCLHKHLRGVFPQGKIIAVVNVADCLPMESYRCLAGVFDNYPEFDTAEERAFGNYETIDPETGRRRYGFVTDGLFRLPEPIPYKAHQGLNELPQLVVEEIRMQWHDALRSTPNGVGLTK